MVLSPVIGPPPNLAQELTNDLIAAGKERNLTLVTSGSGQYTLRGYLVATPEKRGAKVSYVWDVSDSKGARVVRASGEEVVASRSGGDPWSGVDSAALRSIAGKSTSQIVASMPRGGFLSSSPSSTPPPQPTAAAPPSTSTPAPAAEPPRGQIMALVSPVSGAPGDGRSSLTAAVKKKLYEKGVKLAGGSESAGRNVYLVKGNVSLTDATGGKQNIRIDWQVIGPDGKVVGTALQKNVIPKGSLNGPWGAIAEAVATEAAVGIAKLIPKTQS
jgi:hypothetical protein